MRRVARLCVLALAGGLLSVVPGGSVPAPAVADAGCAGATAAPTAGTLNTSTVTALLCLVNSERAARGLPVLYRSTQLDAAARSQSTWMAQHDIFAHQRPAGHPDRGVADRVDATGYRWSAVGENLAVGQPTPAEVFREWLASASHCRTVLSPDYVHLGTGLDLDGIDAVGHPPVPGPTWAQVFARPSNRSAPSTLAGPANACPIATPLRPHGSSAHNTSGLREPGAGPSADAPVAGSNNARFVPRKAANLRAPRLGKVTVKKRTVVVPAGIARAGRAQVRVQVRGVRNGRTVRGRATYRFPKLPAAQGRMRLPLAKGFAGVRKARIVVVLRSGGQRARASASHRRIR